MPYSASLFAEIVTFPDKISCFQPQVQVSRWASSKDASLARRASSARLRSSRSVFVPYRFATFPDRSRRGLPRKRDQRNSPSKRGSGPPLHTAFQNSKLPGMFPEFVAGRLDESQPPNQGPKLALQIDPYSPASADCETLPSRLDQRTMPA